MSAESRQGSWYLDASPAAARLWLARLHWAQSAAAALVLLGSLIFWSEEFPLHRLAPLITAAGLLHGDSAWRLARNQRVPQWLGAAALGVDIIVLTGLLELSGGPSNPFAVVYVVQIALAAVTLGRGWALVLGGAAAAAFTVLVVWHFEELVPSHHRLIDFPTHLFTMWLALSAVAQLVGHFIREATVAVADRERRLEEMRAQSARRERLLSLSTLAAGAAHELSTPLATIAVAAHELERALAAVPADQSWTDDARLIREQVERCHAILDQMSGRAGGAAADLAEPTDLTTLFDDVRRRLTSDQARRVRMQVTPSTISAPLLPRAGLSQVLLSLVKNAFDATEAPKPVVVEGSASNGIVRLVVRDEGSGMSADVLERAGEPFFTTKEPGRGFGLGLFLARMFAERWGGSLTLQSSHGTTAVLELPVSSGPS